MRGYILLCSRNKTLFYPYLPDHLISVAGPSSLKWRFKLLKIITAYVLLLGLLRVHI